MRDDQLSFWLGLVCGIFVTGVIVLVLVLTKDCAHASEPNLDGADFIADAQFLRWVAYAERRSPEYGLKAVTMIERAARLAEVDDYGKMVAVAYYEGRFKADARSPHGKYNGMFQVDVHFAAAMKEMGLDYWCEADRLHYGMLLFKWHGLRPWVTASLARRDYRRVMDDCGRCGDVS
jgi:hypothetical protein